MCWRDEVPMARICISCGQEYYGDLGHRDCPARKPKTTEHAQTESNSAHICGRAFNDACPCQICLDSYCGPCNTYLGK